MADGRDLFFGGVTALAASLDQNIMLVLRDGKVLIGRLASHDQYGSIVLEAAKERISAGGKFAEVYMGLYMIRGENIVLLGELVRYLFCHFWTCSGRASKATLAESARSSLLFCFFHACPSHRIPPPAPIHGTRTTFEQDEEKDAANPRLVRAEEEEVRKLMEQEEAGEGGGAGASAKSAALNWAFD